MDSSSTRGRLLLCQHGARRIVRLENDERSQTVIVDRFGAHRLNNPNDLALHSSGAIYFTDPSYGFKGRDASPLKEIPWNGVYRVAQIVPSLSSQRSSFPQRPRLQPDEKTLYVGNSDAALPRVMAFEVRDDGLLGASRQFFDAVPFLQRGLRGTCDGLKVDVEGHVFTTAPGGVAVLSPDGKHLGTILVGTTSNCNWGDDGATLYITAGDRVCRIRTRTRTAVPQTNRPFAACTERATISAADVVFPAA